MIIFFHRGGGADGSILQFSATETEFRKFFHCQDKFVPYLNLQSPRRQWRVNWTPSLNVSNLIYILSSIEDITMRQLPVFQKNNLTAGDL